MGHDICCTSWESLKRDAEYKHPHISKLMDSQIVYCADEKYREELEALREQVRKKLVEPFGEADYRKAESFRCLLPVPADPSGQSAVAGIGK